MDGKVLSGPESIFQMEFITQKQSATSSSPLITISVIIAAIVVIAIISVIIIVLLRRQKPSSITFVHMKNDEGAFTLLT